MMKLPIHLIFRGVMTLSILLWSATSMGAELEWKVEQEVSLDAQPLDLAVSADGEWVFFLMPGEIQAYSSGERKNIARIPVDRSYDRLAHSSKNNELILTSSTGKKLQIIRLDLVHPIDISGLPFKGTEKAPVTIAVFSDYQ